MDFTSNSGASSPNGSARTPAPSASVEQPRRKSKSSRFSRYAGDDDGKLLRIITVVLLFSIAIILIGLALLIYYNPDDESGYLKSGAYQAIDLNTGGTSGSDQIYFAKISNINSQYFVLQNVYFIPASQKTTQVTLSPLVCQIDSPFDQMVVNRSSINWWENLQSSSKVVKSINSYQKSGNGNPSCPSTSSSTTSTSSSTPSTSTPAATSTTTPAATTSTTKATTP